MTTTTQKPYRVYHIERGSKTWEQWYTTEAEAMVEVRQYRDGTLAADYGVGLDGPEGEIVPVGSDPV